MRVIRLFAARFGISLQTFAFLLLALAAQEGLATQAQAQIPIVKFLCAGTPVPFTPLNDSGNCTPAQVVPVNSPAFYVFKITNPPGVAPRIVSLADAFPGFTLSGPVTCRDPAGLLVALAGTGVTNGIGEFALGSNATVICFAPGQFTSIGSKSNVAIAKDKETNTQGSATHTVQVVAPTPLNTDLQLLKTVSAGPADVTGGPTNLTYTITIHNNGPAVDVGNLFVLHDDLRLLPNSIPLRATVISWNCAASVATTKCLDTVSGPVLATTPPVMIGSMAPTPIFSWGFPPGPPSNGHIDAGATITLTIVMKIEKLPAWTCVQQLNADGLRNTTFFTLTNATAGITMTELNAGNNTAIVDKSVLTGTNVVPNCGKGQLRIIKDLVTPQPVIGFPWSQPWIEYEIRLTNMSMPAQNITVQGGKLQDWVAVGVNTPLPRRTTIPVSPACVSGPCGALTVAPTPPFQYSFYTQSAKAWQSTSSSGFVLAPGATARIRTRLRYHDPSCETVPNANPKYMWNIAMVDYMATPVGMAGPLQAYHGEAQAPVLMQPHLPCPFVTKKRLVSAPAKVTFGSVLQYEVKYSNVGTTPHSVGTVMDAVRITDPGYALSLPFTSTWTCTSTGGAVVNLNASGSLTSGSATYAVSPAHGSPAIRLHANPSMPLVFPAGSTVTCQVSITVQRPSFGDPFCTSNPVQFENFGLMEKALPYNPNPIAWPPGVSGLYVPTSASNPTPQSRNWASVRLALPRCFDAIINKEATVDGLPPTSAPWIYTPGTPAPDIHYRVKVTNTAQGPLTGSGFPVANIFNGLMVVDTLGSPYSALNLQPDGPSCPGGWCASLNNPAVGVGALSLPSLQTGVWQFKFPGTSFLAGKNMINCASLVRSGSFATPDWYPHYDPAAPAPSVTNTTIANPQHSCMTIPIFPTAKVRVVKITRTPQNAFLPNGGPFPVQLTCTPYFIPGSNSAGAVTTTMSTGGSGLSQPWDVFNVPIAPGETCQVSEGSLANVPIPPTPTRICPPGHTAQWGPPTTVPASFTPVPGTTTVAVTNQVICVRQQVQMRELRVTKIVNFLGLPPPPGSFTIQLNCSGGANPPSVTLSHNTSATVQVPVNATCNPIETSLPPLPVFPGVICSWNPPIFQPPIPFTVNTSGPPALMVFNSPTCVKQP